MSRRLTFAVVAWLGCFAHVPARCAEAAAPTAGDRDVEALLTKRPESIDEWESRRPALVGWLRSRVGETPREATAWSVSGDAIRRDSCRCFSLRYSAADCGRLFVPAKHVGRGPAVVFFAGGAMPARIADRNRERSDSTWDACEDLARAGYVVMLIYEPEAAAARQAAPQAETVHADLRGVEFLLERPEVDPDRVAVLGVEATARRAWWVAALEPRLAAVAALGTPETSTLEDRVLACLIAPRPHRLALDIKVARDRQAAHQHWVAGPHTIYEFYELPSLLSVRVGAGFGSTPAAPAWHDTLRWLKDEL